MTTSSLKREILRRLNDLSGGATLSARRKKVDSRAGFVRRIGDSIDRRLARIKRRRRKGTKRGLVTPEYRRRRVDEEVNKADEEVAVDEKELLSALCRESFYDFVKEFWSVISAETPVWNWHVEYLCDELQRMAERVFKSLPKEYDLVVNISPGTTKSTIMSVMFPAWCWTRMPSLQFIGASHSLELQIDLGTKCRDVVESDQYKELFPELALRGDQNSKQFFKNTSGGWRYGIGSQGKIIGKHAHIIVVDDPIDPKTALSAQELKNVNYWIDNELSNRKVNKAVAPMVLVMQRISQDDPTDLFLKRKRIRHVKLPAESRTGNNVLPRELFDRYKREPHRKVRLFDPVRLDRAVLMEERQKGEQYFSSQFLQSPVPPGGAIFKVNRLAVEIRVPEKLYNVVRFWDKAGSKGGGAWTVGTKIGKDAEGRYWVLDVKRFQLDSYGREREIVRTAEEDGKSCLVGIEQEPGSGGKESAENTERRLAAAGGYRCVVVKVDVTTGGKLQRADPWSVQVNSGNVRLVKDEWNKDWILEHKFFPFSRFKDQVDSAALAFALCFRRKKRVGGLRSKHEIERGREKFLSIGA